MNIIEGVREVVEYIENFVVMQVLCGVDLGVDYEVGYKDKHIIFLYIRKTDRKQVLLNIEYEKHEDECKFCIYNTSRSGLINKTDYYFEQRKIPKQWDGSFTMIGKHEDLVEYLKYILGVEYNE